MFHSSFVILWTIIIMHACANDAAERDQEGMDTVAQPDVMCRQQKLCNECVKQHPTCNWCIDPNFQGMFRCDTAANLERNKCGKQNIYNTKSAATIVKEEDLEIGSIDAHKSTVQLRPQRLTINVPLGEPATFPLTYQHASGQTQDLYMLNSNTEKLNITLAYSVDCKGKIERSSHCPSVSAGENVHFNVSVLADKKICDSDQRGGVAIGIGVPGVKQQVVLVVIPLCGCQCAKVEQQEQRSSYCSEQGSLVCGQCQCDAGWGGSKCDCPLPSGTSAQQQEELCRNQVTGLTCSGRGKCNCGECECSDALYVGRYCECDNAACPRTDDKERKLCSGSGDCQCGVCQCHPGWTGEDCSCKQSHDDCRGPDDDAVCSGRGICECGHCLCTDASRSGKYCECDSETCPTQGYTTTVKPTDRKPTTKEDSKEDTKEKQDQQGDQPVPTGDANLANKCATVSSGLLLSFILLHHYACRHTHVI